MKTVAIVGLQWGDEGKGKLTDILAENSELVVRWAGGANAGHTIVVGDKTFITHLVPSGILHEGCTCAIASSVVLCPKTLVEEVGKLKSAGVKDIYSRLVISPAVNIVMPYHKYIDGIDGGKIGTTKQGIGPCYEDKAARRGIRVEDLKNLKVISSKIKKNLKRLHRLYPKSRYKKELDHKYNVDFLRRYNKRISKLAAPVSKLVYDLATLDNHEKSTRKNILFEGAQGALLDNNHGDYPFVTSSCTLTGGICGSVGIGPNLIDEVVGVFKAYCTRVGNGIFPTEDFGNAGDHLKKVGHEYGATTGRERRCGWLDLPRLKHAIMLTGATMLVLTKLDVLTGLDKLLVCVDYDNGGKPIFHELEGWKEDLTGVRRFEDLPEQTQHYVDYIDSQLAETGIEVNYISVGPGRHQGFNLK
jgi:adenylosuccinate synthase